MIKLIDSFVFFQSYMKQQTIIEANKLKEKESKDD